MLGLLCLSAFFSGSETALFSLSRTQRRRLGGSRSPFRQEAARLASHPRRLLMTVLFGNMTVNVGFFALAATLSVSINHRYGHFWAALSGVVALMAVILLGEVAPKNVAAAMPTSIAPIISMPLWAMQWLIRPIHWLLVRCVITPLTRLITGRKHRAEPYVTHDELQDAARLAADMGTLSAEESAMLGQILALSRTKLKEVMTPRVNIIGCDVSAPTAEASAMLRRERLTKIPVWNGSADEIVGVVYAKEMLLDPSRPLAELAREVRFLPETKSVESTLRHFQKTATQLAIAVDEYGGTAGLVTMKDCLRKIIREGGAAPGDGPQKRRENG